jgi:hypothetical protein
VSVVNGAKEVQHGFVDESEISAIDDYIIVRKASHQAIESFAYDLKKLTFLPRPTDSNHNIMPIFPLLKEEREQCRRVLEVTIQLESGVTTGETVSSENGILETEIPRKPYNANAGITRGELGEDFRRSVFAVIVREHDFEIVPADLLKNLADFSIGPMDIVLFVVDRNHDADELPSARLVRPMLGCRFRYHGMDGLAHRRLYSHALVVRDGSKTLASPVISAIRPIGT